MTTEENIIFTDNSHRILNQKTNLDTIRLEVEIEQTSDKSKKMNKIIIPPLKGLSDLSGNRSLYEGREVTFKNKDNLYNTKGSHTDRDRLTVKNNTLREENIIKEYNIVKMLKNKKTDR